MRTYITSLLLVSLVAVSTGLKCWDSGSEFVNMRATNSIVEKTCESSAKSCMKEWYKVVSWGDIYYKLGCSTSDPMAEKSEMKGSTKSWKYSCNSDYCNSSGHLAPVMATVFMALSVALLR